MNEPLDVDQVIDLMFNGLSREGAAIAVAESHGFGSVYPDTEPPAGAVYWAYVDALLAALHPEPYEGETL